VGIRKAIGSQRKQLILQFLTESVLVTFVAFLFAVVIVQLALPSFNTLAGTGYLFTLCQRFVLGYYTTCTLYYSHC
jgi:putative ABC transport system permease protein